MQLNIYSKELNKDMKMLFKMFGKRIWSYAFGIIGASLIFVICFNTLMAFITKDIFDGAIKQDMALLTSAMYRTGIIIIVTGVFAPILMYICYRSIKESMADLRLKLFNHIERLPMQFFDSQHSGQIMSRLTNDMGAMEQAYFMPIFTLLMAIFTGISSISVLLWLNWKIALGLIMMGILSFYINSLYANPIRVLSKDIQKGFASLTEYLVNLLSGFYVVKMFPVKDYITKQYEEKNDNQAAVFLKLFKNKACLETGNYVLSQMSYLGVIIIGAVLAVQSVENVGMAMACIRLQGGITKMFLSSGLFLTNIQRPLEGAKRINEILNILTEERIADNAINKENKDAEYALEIKDLSFGYRKGEYNIKDVNVSVKRGQIAALVGPSGCGKSTLFKLLLGLYMQQEGQIFINGVSAEKYSLFEQRNLFSYVSQDSYLFDASIAENISYGKEGTSMKEIIDAAKAANAHDFISELPAGYNTITGEKGAKLSVGQRQRIALARAFIKDAPILLLDEVTASLDSQSERQVHEAIETLMKERTVLIVTHKLEKVENADIIYVIKDGSIIQKGNHSELLKSDGVYKEMCECIEAF